MFELLQQACQATTRDGCQFADARLQEIIVDPEFRQQIQSGNPADLLTNPRLLELANIVFSAPVARANADREIADTEAGPEPAQDSSKKTKIHSWIDKKSSLHISDIKPDS